MPIMSVAKLEKKEKLDKTPGLLIGNPVYKPFRYPWCYDAWLTQQRIHWLPEEVPLGDDVRDWQKNLNQAEKNLLTQIFRLFTQSDVDVGAGYFDKYIPLFKKPELRMMMGSFANIEWFVGSLRKKGEWFFYRDDSFFGQPETRTFSCLTHKGPYCCFQKRPTVS